MTQVIIKNKITKLNKLPMNEWYLVRRIASNEIRTVIRPPSGYHSEGNVVYYLNDCGISYDLYDVFQEAYEVIGPVNTIEVY